MTAVFFSFLAYWAIYKLIPFTDSFVSKNSSCHSFPSRKHVIRLEAEQYSINKHHDPKSISSGSWKVDRVFVSKIIVVVFRNKYFLHKCWVEAVLCLKYFCH